MIKKQNNSLLTYKKQHGITHSWLYQNYLKEIREIVPEKRKARRWQQTRSSEDKRLLNKLCVELKQVIREIKNASLTSFLRNLSDDKETDYSLWKASKYLKRPKNHIPPIYNDDGC